MPAFADVEVIEITAQKRKSTLQETNLAVTTWDASQLADRQIEDMIDLREFVPNVTVEPNANGNGFFIGSRGIAQADATLITRDPAVAVYIDGVYWGRTIGNLIDVLDIQRIEVLRGPQGALYGRNSASGAVNFVTRKSSGGYGTQAQLRGGSGEGPNGTIADLRMYQEFPVWGGEGMNAPAFLGDLSGSVSFATLNRDAWFINNSDGVGVVDPFTGTPTGTFYTDGPDTDGRDRLATRVALHQESGNFTADFAADYTYAREQGPEMQLTNLGALTTPGNPDFNFVGNAVINAVNGQQSVRRKRDLNILGSFGAITPTQPNGTGAFDAAPGLKDDKTKAYGASLTLQYNVDSMPLIGGSMLIKQITGYRGVQSDTYQDRDGAPADVFSNFLFDDVDQWTSEIDFIGSTDIPGFGLDYTLGHFFLNEQGKQEAGQYALSGIFGSPASLGFPKIKTWAHAVYGHFTFTPRFGGWFEERVKAEFGFRQTWETKHISNSAINLTPVAGLPATFFCENAGGATNLSYGWANCADGQNPTRDPIRAKKSFSQFTPQGTVSFKVNEAINTYVSIGQGFVAGGFNGRANTPTELATPYKAELQTAYEGGVKFVSDDGKIRLNIAGFYTEIENMQRTQLAFVGDTTTVSSLVRNAADATVRGVEIEMMLNPIEGMFIDFAYGLQDGKYEVYCDQPASDLTPGAGVVSSKCAAPELNFAKSRRLGNIPEHNVAWGIQHSFPVPQSWGFSEVSVRLNGYWQSRTWLQNGTRNVAGDPGYHTFSLRAVLRDISLGDLGTADFAIWGRNLGDEMYRPFGIDFNSSGNGTIPVVVQYFGERRTLGAEIVWRFGTML